MFRGPFLLRSIRCSPSCFAGVLLALLFFGALGWARGRDPFQRVWFKVKVPGLGKAECIAALPKNSLESKVQSPKSGGGRWPVVVYLQGLGGRRARLGRQPTAGVPIHRRAVPDAAGRSGRPGELPFDPVLAGTGQATLGVLDAGLRVGVPLAVVLAAGNRKMCLLEPPA